MGIVWTMASSWPLFLSKSLAESSLRTSTEEQKKKQRREEVKVYNYQKFEGVAIDLFLKNSGEKIKL